MTVTLDEVTAVAAEVGSARLVGDASVAVLRAVHDSRHVRPGDLFLCVRGQSSDGHDHASTAIAAGAVALVCERMLGLGVPEVRVASVRAAMGPIAAAVAGRPTQRLTVLGVTGTNGKTTVVHLLASILEAVGRSHRIIGTLTGTRTTPEAPELQEVFRAAVADGVEVVAMEVSSHALDQQRMAGTRVAVAGFTNLSPDHLDHHVTMDAYFAAKARLFTAEISDRAVVCRDDERGRQLIETATIDTVGIGIDDAGDLVSDASGSEFTWRGQRVRLPLPGRFNVRNALVAAEMAVAAGMPARQVAEGLSRTPAVPGRMESIDAGQPFSVVVDYAHTPDGLTQVIGALQEVEEGRLIVVFGCGGDRDAAKRPLMGRAASEADVVVLTSDNPRSEDPGAIIDAVRAGILSTTELIVEPDRETAIGLAVAEARAGDTVLIAGKGHESTQDLGHRVVPLDDREVARRMLERGADS